MTLASAARGASLETLETTGAIPHLHGEPVPAKEALPTRSSLLDARHDMPATGILGKDNENYMIRSSLFQIWLRENTVGH